MVKLVEAYPSRVVPKAGAVVVANGEVVGAVVATEDVVAGIVEGIVSAIADGALVAGADVTGATVAGSVCAGSVAGAVVGLLAGTCPAATPDIIRMTASAARLIDCLRQTTRH